VITNLENIFYSVSFFALGPDQMNRTTDVKAPLNSKTEKKAVVFHFYQTL